MHDPPSYAARINIGTGCGNLGSHAHVQLDYASIRFNCTLCQQNMMWSLRTAHRTITSINMSSRPEETSTPNYTRVTGVFSSNITPMESSYAITTTNTSDFIHITSSGPTQYTANSTCSCGPVAMDKSTTIQHTPTGHTSCPEYTNMVTTTTIYTTTFSPTITSYSTILSSLPPLLLTVVLLLTFLPATTLHGVYMTVLLVLVAVTITMTTLVVYMCLMMRRAKSGRVPQTTTGTTHTNNMAASDYCEPISLRYVQITNRGA